MEISKKFLSNIESRVIIEEMLELALHSINKRAKNCRDKKKEYYLKGKKTGYEADFNTSDKYKEQEKEYYQQKVFLLKELLKPNCIHESMNEIEKRVRYFNYDQEFIDFQDRAIYCSDYFDKKLGEYVEFIDVVIVEKIKQHYLFYETTNYSFHIPIEEEEVEREMDNNNINKIIEINLKTKGQDVKELMPIEFIEEIVKLVESREYKFIK